MQAERPVVVDLVVGADRQGYEVFVAQHHGVVVIADAVGSACLDLPAIVELVVVVGLQSLPGRRDADVAAVVVLDAGAQDEVVGQPVPAVANSSNKLKQWI